MELRKLPKDTTPLLTTIHTSCLQFIAPDNLPPYTTNSYATLAKASAVNAIPNKRPATHIPDTLPTPDVTNPATFDIVEINDHKTLLHQTIYHVSQLKTDHLTAKHPCDHIHGGLTPEHRNRINPEDEDTPILSIPFEVNGSEDIVRSLPNGSSALQNYRISKPPLRKKTRTAPQPLRLAYTTYTTHPINPDLDAVPTGSFVITSHPTSPDSVLIHAPYGRLISPILKSRL